MNKTVDILCVGNPTADVIVRCERLPAWDDKCRGQHIGTFAGGTESNVACAASRFGWNSAIFGAIGDDGHGSFLRDDFHRHGVDTRWLEVRDDAASAACTILLSRDGERAILWVPIEAPMSTRADLDQALAASRLVYTMPYDLDELARLSKAAHRHGCEVVIDVEREAARQPGLLMGLLDHVDTAFMNESGFTTGLKRAVTADNLRTLKAAVQAQTIVVTLGARGAIAIDEHDHVAFAGAHMVDVIDTTGAGDTFNASFMVARHDGASLQQALETACEAASHIVGAVGSRTALPTSTSTA